MGSIVKGKVKLVNKTSLVLVNNGTETTIRLPENSFCPIKPRDVLIGYVINGVFAILPAVEISVTKDDLKYSISTAIWGTKKVELIYDLLIRLSDELVQTNLNVIQVRDNFQLRIAETISAIFQEKEQNGLVEIFKEVGLSASQVKAFSEWWKRNFIMRRLYLLGLTNTEIYECYQNDWNYSTLYYQLRSNPYMVYPIPQEKAMLIAQRYGIRLPVEYPVCGEIIRQVYNSIQNKGWACYPIYSLSKQFPQIFDYFSVLTNVFRCRIRYNYLYISRMAESEDVLTFNLTPSIISNLDPQIVENLTQQQIEAVRIALNNRVSVIIGAGGTGKTFTLSRLCQELTFRGYNYLVATFTGKASARIRQLGIKSNTLHMILLSNIQLEEDSYLIIDEASQIEGCLLSSVIKKLNIRKLRLTFFGDPRQLQPMSGDFFNQVLSYSDIPRIELTEDLRRVRKDRLFLNMRALADEQPDGVIWGEDFQLVEDYLSKIPEVVKGLLQKYKPSDIVTVCCYSDQVNLLNDLLKPIYNPDPPMLIMDTYGKVFSIGDRVMMLNNRYDINIMNGEEGTVIKIDLVKRTIRVAFDSVEIEIPTFSLNKIKETFNFSKPLTTNLLTHVWAITPDKAQGSQWPVVVCYFDPRSNFIHRKRVYTALSRASELVVVVSPNENVFRSLLKVEPDVHYDNLLRRLKQLPFYNEYVTPDKLQG